jgi:uncharacterized C2H2 Zn-finger protein
MAVRCPVCGERFATEADMAGHDHEVPATAEHAGAGFACPGCGRLFDQEEDLIRHQAEEHGGAPA